MRDVKLQKGVCAICGGSIDKNWAENPILGTRCRSCCYNIHPDRRIFSKDDINLVVKQKQRGRGWWDVKNHLCWEGTEVMINGEVGVIWDTQADCSRVRFKDVSEPIEGLGYWDLLRIYKEVEESICLSRLEN